MKRKRRRTKRPSPLSGGDGASVVLPPLATATQIAAVLQISARCVHQWAEKGLIQRAVHHQRGTVRFRTASVASALGLEDLPAFRSAVEAARTTLSSSDAASTDDVP